MVGVFFVRDDAVACCKNVRGPYKIYQIALGLELLCVFSLVSLRLCVKWF